MNVLHYILDEYIHINVSIGLSNLHIRHMFLDTLLVFVGVTTGIARTIGSFCVVVTYHAIKNTGDVLEDPAMDVDNVCICGWLTTNQI